MSGPNLCNLSTQFGLQRSYAMGGQTLSRWMYMEELLDFLNKQDRVHELLTYLFTLGRFTDMNALGDLDKVNETHKGIVQSAWNAINAQLLTSKKELRIVSGNFVLANIGEKVLR